MNSILIANESICSGDTCNILLYFYPLDTTNNYGILEYFDLSYSFDGFNELSQSYNTTTYETSTEGYDISISYNPSIYPGISAVLNYNGIDYAAASNGSGNYVTFSKSLNLDSSLVGSNNFYWTITLTNDTGSYAFNSTTNQQNVTAFIVAPCDYADYNNTILNFTAYDEINYTRIDPFYFGGTFEYWIGDYSARKNVTIGNSSQSEVVLCVLPSGINFTTNWDITYDDTESVYTQRNYYKQIYPITAGSLENVSLYLLETSALTPFILKLQDSDLLYLSDYLILTNRYDPVTNENYTVQVAKTDENGQGIGFFQIDTVDYYFYIMHNNTIYSIIGPQKVIPTTAPYTLTFVLNPASTSPLPVLTPNEFIYTLTFNETTGIFTYAYTDNNISFDSARLYVYITNASGANVVICNNTASTSSTAISCLVGTATNATYTAIAYLTRDGVQSLVNSIVKTIGSISATLGLYGVFIGMLLILICAFVFRFNEVAAIVLIDIACIFNNFMGFIHFGIGGISAVLAISVILIFLLKR
jgi:hypothetical protein